MWVLRNYVNVAAAVAEEEERSATTSMLTGFVMTEEQIEVLRKQIAAYATICEQLAEVYRSLFDAHLDALHGTRVGHATTSSAGPRIATTRQRWNPTATQLQILEQVFNQENGSPSKQRIKDLTEELSRHGKISETNVIYWFQNRRARIKNKKKKKLASSSGAESELELVVES